MYKFAISFCSASKQGYRSISLKHESKLKMDLKSFLLITFVIHIVRFAYAVPVSITSNEKDEECQTKWSIITPSNLNAIYGENLKSGSKITQKILIGRW